MENPIDGLEQRVERRNKARAFSDEVSEWIALSLVEFDDDQRAAFWVRFRDAHGLHFANPSQPSVDDPMTDGESRGFGSQVIPFGKHAGTRVDEVPLAYLIWLSEQKDMFKVDLKRYVRSKRVQAEQGDPDDWL